MMLVALRTLSPCKSIESTADDLSCLFMPNWTRDSLLRHMNSMISAGHRYMNIEKALGKGSCLVLGREIPETM